MGILRFPDLSIFNTMLTACFKILLLLPERGKFGHTVSNWPKNTGYHNERTDWKTDDVKKKATMLHNRLTCGNIEGAPTFFNGNAWIQLFVFMRYPGCMHTNCRRSGFLATTLYSCNWMCGKIVCFTYTISLTMTNLGVWMNRVALLQCCQSGRDIRTLFFIFNYDAETLVRSRSIYLLNK